MRQRLVGGLVVAALALGTGEAAAQAFGLPVYNSGIPSGIGLYGDVGFNNDAAGGGTAFGITGRGGFGPLGVTASVATWKPDVFVGTEEESLTSLGATANFKVFGGPLIPLSVTLQGGVGRASVSDVDFLGTESDATVWRFPVGVGIGFNIPNPALAIRPWIAPRMEIRKVSVDSDLVPDEFTETETDFALSGGVELNTLGGLGLHAAADWISTEGDDKPFIISVGLHYQFSLPGPL